MRKLKNGKAPGSDEIVAELVKNGGQVMVDWLCGRSGLVTSRECQKTGHRSRF